MADHPLRDKVAIVTGGGQGLGEAAALVLADRGASVVVTGRTTSTIDAVAAEVERRGGRALAVVGDVGRREDVERTVNQTLDLFGAIDILVNNAQTPPDPGPLTELDDTMLERTFRSGALGTLYFMQACHPHLRARGGGSIVNFGSPTSIGGDRGFAPYVMTKEAIRGLTRVAANEWGPDGIRVNVVCPAAMSPSAEQFRDADPDRWAKIVRQIPLGRMGDPQADVGNAVAALCGDDLRFLTGATLLLDGGRLLVA